MQFAPTNVGGYAIPENALRMKSTNIISRVATLSHALKGAALITFGAVLTMPSSALAGKGNLGTVGKDGRVLEGNSSAAFSSDGKRLAALSGNPPGIKVWDCESGKMVLSFGAPSPLPGRSGGNFATFSHVVFTSDNKRLITAGLFPGQGLAMWDANFGQMLKTFGTNLLSLGPAPQPWMPKVNSQLRFLRLTLSQDGERLYAVAYDYGRFNIPGAAGCWNATEGELEFSLHETSARCENWLRIAAMRARGSGCKSAAKCFPSGLITRLRSVPLVS